MHCSVYGCKTDSNSKKFNKDIMLFRFPNDRNLCKKWIIACKRKKKFNVKNSRICSIHFDENSYERNLRFELLGYSARNRRLLKENSVPTLNLPFKKNKESLKTPREDRIIKRNRTKLVNSILEQSTNSIQEISKCEGSENVEPENNNNNCLAENFNVLVDEGENEIQHKKDIGTNTDIDKRGDIIGKLKTENAKLQNPVVLVTWSIEDVSKMGGSLCSVDGCWGSKENKHRFPNPKKNMLLFKKWVELCRNKRLHDDPEKVYNNCRVCSLHFEKSDFGPNNRINKTAYPKVNMPEKVPEVPLPIAIKEEPIQNEDRLEYIQMDLCDKNNTEIKSELNFDEIVDKEFAEQCLEYTLKFLKQCSSSDVCQEILMLEKLKNRWPQLK